MRKFFILSVCAVFVLSGCGTYTGAGAYTGANLGSIFGSAIGGISGGYRGHHVGTLIGMAGGAVVGAAIGSAADNANKREVHEHYQEVQRQKQAAGMNNRNSTREDNYYDPTNSGDDTLYDFQSNDYTSDYSASAGRSMSPSSSSIEDISAGFDVNSELVISNARFVDNDHDGYIRSNETSKVIFEIHNSSNHPLYDLQPMVVESSGRKNIYISPSIHVEKLDPGKTLRYTAMVKTGRMKNGTATFCVSVLQGDRVMSNVTEFTIKTVK